MGKGKVIKEKVITVALQSSLTLQYNKRDK